MVSLHLRLAVSAALCLGAAAPLAAAEPVVPSVYTNIHATDDGSLEVRTPDGKVFPLADDSPQFTETLLRGAPTGREDGFAFHFADPAHDLRIAGGTVFFSLIDMDATWPLPKFRNEAAIDRDGHAHVKMIGTLDGSKDFIDWTGTSKGHLYYQVKAADGEIMFEGLFAFTADSDRGPFHVVADSIVLGPFLNAMTPDSVTVSFDTLNATDQATVTVPGVGTFHGDAKTDRHEITVTGLAPDTEYDYTVATAGDRLTFGFRTPPAPGSRQPFTFAFGSDSRQGIDSGERHVAGVNQYMLRRVLPVATSRDAAFLQFTGDMINGYNSAPLVQGAQFQNFKRAISPFAHRLPMFIAPGNHEVVIHQFADGTPKQLEIARFPFASQGPEALFARYFVSPTNGPASEDGSALDPDADAVDFPSYRETVYDYVWDNVAMVVLNSDYLYSPYLTDTHDPLVGGNIHGYVMDNQLAWLKDRLAAHQADDAIDHVFVTIHTPIFPNGGHLKNDMYYHGDNGPRPVIAGRPAAQGIIERRDTLLGLIDGHDKVKAVLAGDEHNYSRLEIGPGMPIYAKDGGYRPKDPVTFTRRFQQITNGALGAPYAGREDAPWHAGFDPATGTGPFLKRFTTRFAIVLFHVDGPDLRMEVLDPETLEVIEQAEL